MALAFTRLSWWSWGGKDHEGTASSGSPLNASSDFGLGIREPDSLKFPPVRGSKMHSTSRRVKKKWQSREERRIDREYDLVLVPSDGGCMSGSESDDSDWSIGWLEPHAPDFLSEDELESSFAVLVPCYGRGRSELMEDSKNQLLGAIVSANLSNGYSAESKKCIEEWLSSLQNS
ncbi:hypothetical protein MRB53_017169 [Persea americana]|uniref:Uncharacterized protein n=1 Tax=Persea americana TaxID=3435 RepID=A0ACC2M4B1_PERAE|nr:hypothetical protein MRB53_017169 [Persea americana]|eukprot:TRINITY_DN28910_c0_g1_i1.p1 TRINITY_DN28910_c0_g1~~TRINITY_DN28910_c0_g1_i1.p1  ORF type:complete len:175 (+),score=38.79 TRINITY_DN28910_c0_g1_i1:1097-1621(+)